MTLKARLLRSHFGPLLKKESQERCVALRQSLFLAPLIEVSVLESQSLEQCLRLHSRIAEILFAEFLKCENCLCFLGIPKISVFV